MCLMRLCSIALFIALAATGKCVKVLFILSSWECPFVSLGFGPQYSEATPMLTVSLRGIPYLDPLGPRQGRAR